MIGVSGTLKGLHLRFLPLRKTKYWCARAWVTSTVRVRSRSSFDNIFHCCVQRTASRWLLRVLANVQVFRYSGCAYQPFDLGDAPEGEFVEPRIPKRRIVGPVYGHYRDFQRISKSGSYRAFFVTRDPRDIVVSHYFSTRYSHRMNPVVAQRRSELDKLSQRDGLIKTIQYLADEGLYDALESWRSAAADNAIRLVSYEDLTGACQLETFHDLFSFCDIRMPTEQLRVLLDNYSFERMSGRKKGTTDRTAHYRKGEAGDWRNYFTSGIREAFTEVTENLLVRLGYETNGDW